MVLAMICMGIVLLFSCQTGAASHDLSLIIARRIGEILDYTGFGKQSIEQIDLLVRKSAHLLEYMVLAVLLAKGCARLLGRVGVGSLVAFLAAVSFAGLDEWVQLSYRGRTASMFDVIIDAAGVFLGITAFVLYTRKNRPQRREACLEGTMARKS